jgi:hypothetical protein
LKHEGIEHINVVPYIELLGHVFIGYNMLFIDTLFAFPARSLLSLLDVVGEGVELLVV